METNGRLFDLRKTGGIIRFLLIKKNQELFGGGL